MQKKRSSFVLLKMKAPACCQVPARTVTSSGKAQLFVVGLDFCNDARHHAPQSLLPGGIQPGLLRHDLTDHLSYQLMQRKAWEQ